MKQTLLLLLFFTIAKVGFAQTGADTIVIKKGISTTFLKNNKVLKPKEIEQIISVNNLAAETYSQAKKNIVPATIFGSAGGFLIGYPLGSAIAGGKFSFTMLGVGVGLIGVSIPFTSAYNKHTVKAVQTYNNAIVKASSNLKPKVSSYFGLNGVGIKAVF